MGAWVIPQPSNYWLPVPNLLYPKKADTGIRALQISVGAEFRGGSDHLQRDRMEDRELLSGSIAEDVAIELILFKDSP